MFWFVLLAATHLAALAVGVVYKERILAALRQAGSWFLGLFLPKG